MLDKVKYINHLGETIEFGTGSGFFINYNDLRDFEFDYVVKNGKIQSIREQETVEKKIPIVIACSTEKEGIEARNKIYEVIEKDFVNKAYGKFVIGDFYLKCYVVASEKSTYLESKKTMLLTLTAVTDSPKWIREKKYTFAKASNEMWNTDGLDYPIGYDYDYANDLVNQKITNSNYASANFEMIIYGGCESPSIGIDGHIYEVDASLETGEYITIDSVAKTITKTKVNGETENMFNFRGRDDYIFEKIPSGTLNVTWDGLFGFDLKLLEERSEPSWN